MVDKRVINQERCKHGVSWEFCALCQKVEFTKDVKFPIDKVDDDGEMQRIWLRRKSKQVRYRRYR